MERDLGTDFPGVVCGAAEVSRWEGTASWRVAMWHPGHVTVSHV